MKKKIKISSWTVHSIGKRENNSNNSSKILEYFSKTEWDSQKKKDKKRKGESKIKRGRQRKWKKK